MSKPLAQAGETQAIPRLLYDVETVAKILSLSAVAIDKLCQLGELRPSLTVGNRRLFSVRELERFANVGEPREINLRDRDLSTA